MYWHFYLASAQIKIEWPISLSFWGFCDFWLFSFSYLFAAVVGLLVDLLSGWEFLSKYYGDWTFLTQSSPVLLSKPFLHFSLKFLSILKHISTSFDSITLIWIATERHFPPVVLENKWCLIWSRVIMSEVEQRSMLISPVTDGRGVNGIKCLKLCY